MGLIRPEQPVIYPWFNIDVVFVFVYSLVSTNISPFPDSPWFLSVYWKSRLKTQSEKEKLLVTSNFSFYHSVFYRFRELSAIFIKFEFVVCKLFVVRQRVNQLAPDLVKMCMTVRFQMNSIICLFGSDQSELSSLEIEKHAIFDFIYTLAPTIMNHSEPNLVSV